MGAPPTCSSPPSAPHLLLCLSLLLYFMVMIPTMMGCIQPERESLLDFKAGLVDPSGVLSSWVGDGCCGWRGVKCSNRTGHVVSLHLRNTEGTPGLGGDINPSLLGLKHLEHLDLSGNDFQGIPIPSFIGSLRSLRYLNLSTAGFYGSMDSGRWLSHLRSLKYLNLDDVDLSRASGWLESVNGLPSLSEIHMSSCWLFRIPPHLPHVNFTSLRLLDLSDNGINSTIPPWLFKITGLRYLHLGGNSFYIPRHLPHVNFTSLRVLDLSDNGINSTIPPWLFKITGLRYLYLGGNSFQSLVPASIGNLTSLTVLDLSFNGGIIGGIPTALGNLCTLTELDLSFSRFGGKFNELGAVLSAGCIKESLKKLFWSGGDLTGTLPDWLGGMKNLRTLQLADNKLNGTLPDWLWGIKNLRTLDLSDNKLNGTIPETLGQLSELVELDLRSNDLEGVLSEAHFTNLTRLESLDLSNNSQLALDVGSDWVPPLHLTDLECGSVKMGPAFPAWLRELENLSVIDISNAGISDVMPDWFWNFSSTISYVDLSRNEIRGTLSIDLAYNNVNGGIPEELTTLSRLNNLNLSRNHLTGKITEKIGRLQWLESLDLSFNDLSGAIPETMASMHSLHVLNLSFNNFSGEIPYGGQVQALSDSSIYIGNLGLCGFPLNMKCPDHYGASHPLQPVKSDESDSEMEGFYLCIGSGFAVGLWTVYIILLLNKKWRIAHSRFADRMYDKAYVVLAIRMAKMKNRY